MTAGLENFQVATPDAYAGATPNWKRRMLAAQLLQQQAQTGDKVYGHGLGSMKLLASALGGWMEGKEEKKVAEQVAEADRLMPLPSSGTPNSSTSGGTSTPSGGTAASSPLDTQMRQTFMDTLKEKGLTNPYALAVADSFGQHESNWDPKKLTSTWSDPSESGQAGTSGGALSWRDDRHRNMTDFVSKSGEKDPARAQALFFLNENPDLIKRMQASKGLEDAHDNMSGAWKYAGYDRPGGGEYANRLATARARLAAYQGGQSPATASADESATPDPRAAGQIASIAGTMAPPGAPKAEPVPGPSMAPPDLTSVAIDSATGKPIPANDPRLDTSAIDRAHPRPQTALPSPAEPPVRPPETYPGKPQLAPPGAAPVVPIQPAAQAPPAPQQMAQAQSQPRSQAPAAVSQTAPGATPEEIAFARVIVRNQALGIPVSPVHAQMAKDILSPTWEKLNDGTLYQKRTGRFIEAPTQPYTLAEGAQRRGKNNETLAQNIPSPEVPMTAEQRQAFKVAEGQAAGVDGRGKIHYGPAGQNVTIKNEGTIPPGYHAVRDASGNIIRLDVIPGSPAATEAKQTEDKAVDAERQKKAGATIVTQDIDRALHLVATANLPTTGGVGSFLSKVPNTAAHDVSRLMETVKANAGFDRLQAMRNASPTGGALGNVSDKEGHLLQGAIGNLEQSQDKGQFVDNMKRVKNIYNDIIHGPGKGPEREKLTFQEGKQSAPVDVNGYKIRRID